MSDATSPVPSMTHVDLLRELCTKHALPNEPVQVISQEDGKTYQIRAVSRDVEDDGKGSVWLEVTDGY